MAQRPDSGAGYGAMAIGRGKYNRRAFQDYRIEGGGLQYVPWVKMMQAKEGDKKLSDVVAPDDD